MRPYYDHGGIGIYHGDARELAPYLLSLPSVLALDPPYGTNEHGGYGRRQLGLETIENDGDTTVRDQLLELWGDRCALVFGSPRRPEPPGDWAWRLVWDKRMPGLGSPWRWQHEMIYLRGAWRNQPGISSVLSFPAGNSMRERHHPHEKPVALMCALLQGTTGTILDPTMGSGSTLRAAKELGRKAIGIELDERLCETAARRLSQEVLFA
jgi:site-specific DNA-methyltransferase (adenine-specific)